MYEEKARWIRQQILETTVSAQHGHIGGSLSCVEILIALYYEVMRPQDKFVLSKGQAAQTIYAILADLGNIEKEELKTFCQLGHRLEGHPSIRVPGIEVSSGSLGNGLGIGAGLALASKLDKIDRNIYVLMGDGECYEGSVWEAAMFATHHKLDNLIAIIDRNEQCVLDFTENINQLEPFADKWETFGWAVREVDGHNIRELVSSLSTPAYFRDKPLMIIANTVKGKGISFMEGVPKWHQAVPNEEETKIAREELYGHK